MPGTDEGLRVAVVGGSGYIGGELLRLLSAHPAVGVVRALSHSAAGRAWADLHPALAHVGDAVFEPVDVPAAAAWADVLLLALPHGRSQELIDAIEAADPRLVIDTAADFRIRDQVLAERFYGPHAAPSHLGRFVYGLADVHPAGLAGARRVAAPGCFATAALLAVRAFAQAGMLDGTPLCFAVTGSSGSGAEPKRTTHHPVRAHNFFAYAVDGHRHEAEIAEQMRGWTGDEGSWCEMLTHSGPFVRGIHATLRARLREPLADPLKHLRETWAGSRFVRVLDRPPELSAVVGTNFAHLHAVAREGGKEVVVFSVIDNLVKGGAGQAVQAMNLALGLDEAAGLGFAGLYPC